MSCQTNTYQGSSSKLHFNQFVLSGCALIYLFNISRHFMPLPNTVVGSHCAWKLRLNSVPNRIPGIPNFSIIVFLTEYQVYLTLI